MPVALSRRSPARGGGEAEYAGGILWEGERTPEGHKLPDRAADLNGQIRILLHGRIDTGPGGGIRNTFEVIPDAPVSKFTLDMFGGKRSLIENSEDLCAPQAKTKALARFTAHNGKIRDLTPTLKLHCGPKHRRGGGGHR